MRIITSILSVIILILGNIAKRTKTNVDDIILRVLKIVRSILSIGGFKK